MGLFCIHRLDAVVKDDYVLVYVGANSSSANRPSVGWMRKAYGLFSRNYKKNVQKLYLIHPSTFTRMCLKFFKPFISEKFWRKLVQVDDVGQMHHFISPEQLRLPESCYEVALRKGQKFALFGTSLEKAVEDCPHPSGIPAPLVPVFLHLMEPKCIQTEGLFRVSGSETVMKGLRVDLEAGQPVDWTSFDTHAASGVLKHFVRELRVTTIPPASFNVLAEAVMEEQDVSFARSVAEHLESVPEAHRKFICQLFGLLARVAAEAEVNKMTPQNLAVCLAPHLLRSENSTPSSALKDVATQTNITKRLIQTWPSIIEMNPGLAAKLE